MKNKSLESVPCKKKVFFFLIFSICYFFSFYVYAASFEDIRKRGYVKCGISYKIPGFEVFTSKGTYEGFDTDICRALAVSLFGTKERLEFIEVTPDSQYESLKEEKVDILITVTPEDFETDVLTGIEFTPPLFFDSWGFLVKQKSFIQHVDNINNVKVCLVNRPLYQKNISAFFKERNFRLQLVKSNSLRMASLAFEKGECDAFFGQRVHLLAFAAIQKEIEEKYRFIEIPKTKVVLASAVDQKDVYWLEFVRWVINFLISAEEVGISQDNIQKLLKDQSPILEEYVKEAEVVAKAMHLARDWAIQVIINVGNYGDIFQRNFKFLYSKKFERGLNNLWKEGGLIYSPSLK